MAAAAVGALEAVEALLQAGAPWNAIDRRGRCAGDYAMEGDHAGAAGAILEAGREP
jgi:type IV protein arginine methyltransferase